MTIKVATQKATMDTEKLRESLQKVNFIKPYRQLPVLSNALAEFSNGKAILTTTDMERAIKVEIDSTNTEQFSALLPRKTTEKFLIGGNGKVGITIDKRPNRVVLSRDGIGNLNLTTLPIADFPKIPQPENLTWQKLDAKWFCRMIGIVAIACASELSRPVLTGIACNDGKIAATDGFRLHSFKDNRLTLAWETNRLLSHLKLLY